MTTASTWSSCSIVRRRWHQRATRRRGREAGQGWAGREKSLLTCWLGEHTAREGRRILQDAGVASFETPADAAAAVAHLSAWSQAQHALMRVPSSRSEDVASDPDTVRAIFRKAATEGRRC